MLEPKLFPTGLNFSRGEPFEAPSWRIIVIAVNPFGWGRDGHNRAFELSQQTLHVKLFGQLWILQHHLYQGRYNISGRVFNQGAGLLHGRLSFDQVNWTVALMNNFEVPSGCVIEAKMNN